MTLSTLYDLPKFYLFDVDSAKVDLVNVDAAKFDLADAGLAKFDFFDADILPYIAKREYLSARLKIFILRKT